MHLNFDSVGVLVRTELRMVLRDRRMMLTSLLLPLLVTPLMFLISSSTIKKREQALQRMTYRYSVSGTESATVRYLLAAARERADGSNVGSEKKHTFRLQEVTSEDPAAALNRGEIHFIIEAMSAAEAGADKLSEAHTNSAALSAKKRKTPRLAGEDMGEISVTNVPMIRVVFRADRDESGAAAMRVEEVLRQARQAHRRLLLAARDFPVRSGEVAVVTSHNLASKSQVAGLNLGRTLTLLLLLFILTSGAVIATDSLAGEKERGTLETLLTTAAGRVEILAAKHLVIVIIALLITCIQALNLLVYVSFKLLPLPANLSGAVTPWVAGLLVILFLPVAALAANVLLLISGYARSYKEAQLYFLPALLVGLLPGVAPLLPGVPLRSVVVLVPIANIALAAKEILIGSFDWPMIALAWLVTAAAALWTTRLGVRFLSTERLITMVETDVVEFSGGPALFERQVLRWFAGLWAVLLLVSNYAEKLDLRVQITINLVGIFFLGTCLMIRWYRLDPRTVLALRWPRPAVWLGVLCAVPGGLLSALGLFRLANLIVPVSAKMMEGFDQSVLPPGMSLAQLVFFLGVMPGLFEEMAFRGLLLHGLRRRLKPIPLVLVVGIAFGLFHVALFRLVPTACLGVLLAGVTLLTGSIFPAMLWHALNNATGILVYKLQIPEGDLDPVCYAYGAALLAVSFWIFYRNRTPYPGLRRASRKPAPGPAFQKP
jgi:sodium transport system permease protein